MISSSSYFRFNPFIKFFLHERVLVTFIFSFILISLFSVFAYTDSKGVYSGRFWYMKLGWEDCADVVLAGDSRVCSGLSPAEMQSNLPNERIFNYAFDGNGYSQSYLQSIEKVLDYDSNKKMIILGISPRSLTLMTSITNFYTDSLRTKKYQLSFAMEAFDTLLKRISPIGLPDIYYMLFPHKKHNVKYAEYFSDGWMGRCQVPSEDHSVTVEGFRQFFLKNPVSTDVVDNIMGFTKKWTQSGIKVYAFRPPTFPEMVEMENSVSIFKEEDFISDFEKVGGIWINVKQYGYSTYDGSHLCPDGAIEFSNDFSKLISKTLQ